jgi:hypothetical protein
MWLVLCDANDISAKWAYNALAGSGLAPLRLITADELSVATYWEHRILGDRTTLRFKLANGIDVRGEQLRGVLNRLYEVPIAHWRFARKADQEYVEQELIAFYLSWLHALPCPVINRPTPQGLSGRWRHESEWVWIALRAGLAVEPYRQSVLDRIDEGKGEKRLAPSGASIKTVLTMGDITSGVPAPPLVEAGCKRLAELAGTELLGVDFMTGGPVPWTFVGANPLPDLMLGGPALIRALLERLTEDRTSA